MEDRSSMDGDESVTMAITLHGHGTVQGECRLTALATALRGEKGNRIEWLVKKVCELGLPADEFTCTVGVKVKRGWRSSAPTRLLPEPLQALATVERVPGSTELVAPDTITVDVVAYELLVKWRAGGTVIAIPSAWNASVLENHGQDEAAFRSRIRWVMTELMLARYGLDSYREPR